jgi:hypothetical protein
MKLLSLSGGRGIRTPGEHKPTTVFKTVAFDRSAIPPSRGVSVQGTKV